MEKKDNTRLPINDLIGQLKTDADKGLTKATAQKRLKLHGPNTIQTDRSLGRVMEFLALFKNPLVLTLLAAGAISMALGEQVSGGIIFGMVMLSIITDYWQERDARNAAERLKNEVKTRAQVMREGKLEDIDPETLVPGDILMLGPGNIVSADGRILLSNDLHINQASLTGESYPVEKSTTAPPPDATSISEWSNMVFMGSSVVSGTAKVLVLETGGTTQFGKIAASLVREPEPTDFSKGIQAFGTLILRVTIVLVLFIFLALKPHYRSVGYMGDGINDAPSLRAADVGISVNNATDVAKDAASIILTDKDLSVLRDGILEGRKTFGNTQKYIFMALSSNFGNMFSVAVAAVFLPFLPMLPIQILINNFLYDSSQFAIPYDAVDETTTLRPQRWDMRLVYRFMWVFGLTSSVFDLVTFLLLYKVFEVTPDQFRTGWFMESLATQTLVVFVIRTRISPFWKSKPSKVLVASMLLCVGIGWYLPYSFASKWLGFEPLPVNILAALGGIVLFYLILAEVVKRVAYGTGKEAVS
jgi:magnesium-transporting ATPase (P-type)